MVGSDGEYVFSPTTTTDASKFPKQFRDYPGGVEAFDVYGNIVSATFFISFLTRFSRISQLRTTHTRRVMCST